VDGINIHIIAQYLAQKRGVAGDGREADDGVFTVVILCQLDRTQDVVDRQWDVHDL
jgi:hypothetical protein